jgi:nitroreductase
VSVKASATEWSDRELSLQDLSDLMWAANGLNRPEENKTTASSAMNAHDVDIYAFMERGVFVYDFENHELDPVVAGDLRSDIMMRRPGAPAPEGAGVEAAIQIVLVSDPDRFRAGTDALKHEWGAIGAGIISQNISLFCAATGLQTRPRASLDKEKVKDLLGLKETQHVLLNHPVGYAR